jgi:acyl dehydratase
MRTFDGLSELDAAVGTHLGYSDWHTVTQDQIDRFAEATGDRQWIHVDPERRPDRSARPLPTASSRSRWCRCWPGRSTWFGAWRWLSTTAPTRCVSPAPVPVGSRLRAGIELVSLVASGAGSRAVTRVTVELEGSDKPVCVAETVALLVPGTPEEKE